MSQVERQVVLPAPPVRVWEALADPEQLSAWFGAEASIEVRPRGRATFRWPDGTERGAVVESVEEPRLLVFRWLPFERAGRRTTRPLAARRVRITLEPHEGGTLLTVAETAPSHAPDPPPIGASSATTLLERIQPPPHGSSIRASAP